MLGKFTLLKEEDMIPGEKIIMHSLQSWYVEAFPLILSVVLFFGSTLALVLLERNIFVVGIASLFLLAALILAAGSVFRHYSERYYITTERVLRRTGILSKHIEGVPYAKIQDLQLDKHVIEHLIDIGDISLMLLAQATSN